MKRSAFFIIWVAVLTTGLLVLSPAAYSEDKEETVSKEEAVSEKETASKKENVSEKETASQKESASEKKAASKKAEIKSEKTPAQIWRDDLIKVYLSANWVEYDKLIKKSPKHMGRLKGKERKTVLDIRSAVRVHRPKWWKKCRSSSNVSFKVKMWKRRFPANYMPTGILGVQAPIDIVSGRLVIIVSWRPTHVDSKKKFSNEKMREDYGLTVHGAEDHNFTMGTMAETIVWHELGHNFVSISMPASRIIKFYMNHTALYSHLQELFADMTALYHASPPSRLFTLMFRRGCLKDYDDMECHTRGAHAIGAILLARVLEEPEKWPSLHFPGKVPEKDIERNTIIYMYRHIDPKWTIEEDVNLRDLVNKWLLRRGDYALKSKGKLILPNKKIFWIMATDDRDEQPKRDAWVKEKLEAMIKSGRADDPKIVEKDAEEDDGGFIILRRVRRSKSKKKDTKKDKEEEDDDDDDKEEDKKEQDD